MKRTPALRVNLAFALMASFVVLATSASPAAQAESGGAIVDGPRAIAQTIAVGERHACAVLEAGAVTCWGGDANAQLGNGAAFADVDTPTSTVTLPDGRFAVAVDTGEEHTCALLDNGQITCWGGDSSGQLGNGAAGATDTPPNPVALPTGRTATAVSTGLSHTCALLDNGHITCWGSDLAGELGNGATGSVDAPPAPIALPAGRTATAIATGRLFTCALLDNGGVTCWGIDFNGQLGNAGAADADTPPEPITLPGNRPATAIATGDGHACAILDNGQITCWGANGNGAVGNGSTGFAVTSPTPSPALPTGRTAIALTAGGGHTCALIDNGDVICWGLDSSGQLGNGPGGSTTSPPATPVAMPGGVAAVAIAAGNNSTCAHLSTRAITCWGNNSDGQVGATTAGANVETPSGTVPLPVPDAILAAGERSTCAVRNGGISCWGSSNNGRLGVAPGGNVTAPPAGSALPSDLDATSITTTSAFGCATDTSGAAFCWGRNNRGQWGDGTTVSNNTPLPINATVDTIHAGGEHTCISTDGVIDCAGARDVGVLGDGMFTGQRNTFDLVNGQPGLAIDLDVGNYHSCMVIVDGTVECWGANAFGQLGDGSTTNRSEAVTVAGVTGAVEVAVGDGHSCALLRDGTATCWGSDLDGQLGDGAATTGPAPTPVSLSGRRFYQLAAGQSFTCGLVSGGSVVCWGSDDEGQVGNGASPVFTGDVPSPSTVTLPLPAVAIATGWRHACALLSDGTVTCWGENLDGQLGNGSTSASEAAPTAPVALRQPTLAAGPPTTPPSNVRFEPADGIGVARVQWDAPADAAGPPPVGYVIETSTDSGATWTNRSEEPPSSALRSLRGGPVGELVQYRVAATNPWGRSPFALSPNMILDRRPNAARSVTAVAGNGQATVSWELGLPYVGSPVIGYRAIALPGGASCSTTTALTCTISGLTNGTEYRITVESSSAVASIFSSLIEVAPVLVTPGTPPIVTVNPARLYETRSGPNDKTVDRLQEGTGKRTAGQITTINVAGRPGIPADATGAIFNIAAVGPDGPGFFTAYPCNAAEPPLTSTLNYAAGQVIANGATVKLDPGGNICILTLAAADIVVDVTAFIPA